MNKTLYVPMKSPHFITTLADGRVTLRPTNTATAVATGPRCAVTRNEEIVCSYTVQSALGINDQKPMLARSCDGGITWKEQGFIWQHLHDRCGISGSVSGSPEGDLFYYGTRTPIDRPGEPKWSESTQGLKANELIWARSSDGGHTWSDPTVIPMPTPGSAEAPGALCVAHNGTWHACYAPYNTFDPDVVVPRNQIVLLSSSDEGRTWRHTAMMHFNETFATGAEAWVVELADGRLLGTCWNLNQRDGSDFPNAYALSHDGGYTWSPTGSTGIRGQTTSLAASPDGSALFIYNQRKHGEVGVWLARVHPSETDFGIESNEIAWKAARAATYPSDTGHSDWTSFAFGQPSATLLPDGTTLIVLWCLESDGGTIRFLKLRAE